MIPAPLTLVEKRPKILRLLLTAVYLLFLIQGVAGILLALSSNVLWLALFIVVFCIAEIGFCLYLLKMNRDPELVLTEIGFSERTETDFRRFNWADVDFFEVYSFQAPQRPRRTQVGFRFSNSFRQSRAFQKVRLIARAERRLTGYDWHLSNCYGRSPEALATLMNQYRQQWG